MGSKHPFAFVAAALALAVGCQSAPAAASTLTPAPAPPTAATRASQLEVQPTSAPTAPGLNVVVDGQPLTADSLPSPQAYYASLLAAHGRDYAPCQAAPNPQPGSCPKPSSLGTIDLKPQINVELILDASGSMADPLPSGETKLAAAKRVLNSFLDTLPKNANVALRVYGHKGSSAEADKGLSCASSELLYPFQPLDVGHFQQAIDSFQPQGWTPLAASFEAARDDFAQFDPASSSNFVYVVTDGIETCDGDPVAAAGDLHASNVQPLVNIVGFDLDPGTADQLQQAADAGGGTFYQASNAAELNRVFLQDTDWQAWTKYYNCLYAVAVSQHNQVTASQVDSHNCSTSLAFAEHNDIAADARSFHNRATQAAVSAHNDLVNRSDITRTPAVDQIDAQFNALIDRLDENFNYAIDQADTRFNSIINASDANFNQAINQADADFQQAVSDADAQRDRGPTP